jgi:hypothetical protein
MTPACHRQEYANPGIGNEITKDELRRTNKISRYEVQSTIMLSVWSLNLADCELKTVNCRLNYQPRKGATSVEWRMLAIYSPSPGTAVNETSRFQGRGLGEGEAMNYEQ